MKAIFTLLAATFILCGCQPSAPPTSTPPPGAHLSRAEALAIARQAALEHKVNLRKYQRPVISFMSDFGQWSILWPNRASTEGFEVVIDDKTGKIVSAKGILIDQTVPCEMQPHKSLQPLEQSGRL